MPDPEYPTELVSLEDLKLYLGITSEDETLEANLQATLDAVQKAVQNYCGRTFLAEERTEYRDGGGLSKLLLEHYPILDLDSVFDDTTREFAASTEIDAEFLIVGIPENDDIGQLELLGRTFTKGQKNIKVVYTGGYDEIPDDLALAVKKLCQKERTVQTKGMSGQVTQTVGDRTITISPEGLPRDVYDTLQQYRRLPLP